MNGLAERLREIALETAGRQVGQEIETVEIGEGEHAGLHELLDEMAELLPDWLIAVETDPLLSAQFRATQQEFDAKRRRLVRGDGKKRSALLIREGSEFIPLEQRHVELAEIYLRRTVQLDPLVNRALRIVREHAESRSMLAELESSIDAAMENINTAQLKEGIRLAEWARSYAHVSRVMRTLAELSERANRMVVEANEKVRAWHSQLSDLDAQIGPSEPGPLT